MGLDSFTYDSEDDETEETTSEEDEIEEEESETEEQNEEQEEENETTGIDAFRSENLLDQEEEEVQLPWENDFAPGQWNALPEEEKVEYIRNNYWTDYRYEYGPKDHWDYTYVAEITCKCRDTVTIQKTGMCLTCGRTYEDHGNVVELVDDPETEQ